MIRMLVMYPRSEGSQFDGDYWLSTHMPLCATSWPQLKRWEADLAGDDAPYHAAAHLFFESMEDFGAAIGSPATAAVMSDTANYTNVQTTVTLFNVASTS